MLDKIVGLIRSSVEVEKTPADLQEVVLNIINALVIACLSRDCQTQIVENEGIEVAIKLLK